MLAVYYRALKRVERRSATYRADHSARAEALLREACRLANFLAVNCQPHPRSWPR